MGATGYIQEIRRQLTLALCLHNFPSQVVERHNKPEVEVRTSPELLLPPVTIRRNDVESCLIEQSINSTRVSFKFRATDQVEAYLIRTYLSFMVHRAEQLDVVRRVPLDGFDITFLFTHSHVERYERERLVNFVCQVDPLSACCAFGLAWDAEASTRLPSANNSPLPVNCTHYCVCVQLVEGFSAEISEMKLSLKTRARAVVDDFWSVMEQRHLGQPQK